MQPSPVHSLQSPVYTQFSAFHCHACSTKTYQSHTDVKHFKGGVVHVLSKWTDLSSCPVLYHISCTYQSFLITDLSISQTKKSKHHEMFTHSGKKTILEGITTVQPVMVSNFCISHVCLMVGLHTARCLIITVCFTFTLVSYPLSCQKSAGKHCISGKI